MNKLVIIESGDRLGKGSLIKGICEYYDYKNITIRHCDKPPKNLSSLESSDFQFKCFEQECELISEISHLNSKYSYHNNIIIYDRFYPGEYVYSQMFRNGDPSKIKNKMLDLERKYITTNRWITPYLITLTADPNFFLSKEDGKSFSQNIEQKSKELSLFKEVHEFSKIKNKLIIKVDNGNNEFRFKSDILNEAIEFIENN